MRAAGLKPIAVSITAGKRSRRAEGMVYVRKRELVRGLVTAFENGRLKIAKRLPLAGALLGELRAFQVRFTAKGRDTYGARSGKAGFSVFVRAHHPKIPVLVFRHRRREP